MRQILFGDIYDHGDGPLLVVTPPRTAGSVSPVVTYSQTRGMEMWYADHLTERPLLSEGVRR